jgi:PHP family Zn ribbon phosphoesterase
MQFDALEVSARLSLKEARRVFPSLSEWSLISSSDAHFIEDIGRAYTQLLVEAPTVEELKLALKNEKGRVVFTEE